MALDRWIAFIFLMICLAYCYAAFFTIDATIPPFMKRNPVWPSTFPKVLSVLGIFSALYVLTGFEKPDESKSLMLRPAGFLASTFGFLVVGALVLGERRFVTLIVVALIASVGVWYLVEGVLGIFLRPLPFFMGT